MTEEEKNLLKACSPSFAVVGLEDNIEFEV
jgi:hypothetical protein